MHYKQVHAAVTAGNRTATTRPPSSYLLATTGPPSSHCLATTLATAWPLCGRRLATVSLLS